MYKDIQCLTISLFFIIQTANASQDKISILSDLENGTAVNYYGQNWFVVDDSLDHGNTKVTNLAKDANGAYIFKPTAGAGNPNTGGTPGYGAKIAFKLGTVNPGNSAATWGSMVIVGTRLAPQDDYMDLTGAQKIEFSAKVERPEKTPAMVDLRVEVCTKELEDDYGYYHIIIPISGTWAMYTIPLDTVDRGFGKLVQWDWSITFNGKKPFNITKITKIQWTISEDGNVMVWKDASGALYLDDISISPFIPHCYDELDSTSMCTPGAIGYGMSCVLCNFDISLKNSLGYTTYCFTDREKKSSDSGRSSFTGGAIFDSTAGTYILKPGDSGINGTKCASIDFSLGESTIRNSTTILPYVGIGTDLSAIDTNGTLIGNAFTISADPAIYFDYKLQSESVKYIRFEIITDPFYGNPDAIYYVKCPNTGGEWKGVYIDLDALPAELVLPHRDGVTQVPMDKTKLIKLQWKVQGAPGAKGNLAIDNIYIGRRKTDVKPTIRQPITAFHVTRSTHGTFVSFFPPYCANNARIDLLSLQGKMLATRSVARDDGEMGQIFFPTNRLAKGLYFVKVKYGNKDVKSAMISIIK